MYVVPAYTNIILIVINTTYLHIVPKKRKTLHIVDPNYIKSMAMREY